MWDGKRQLTHLTVCIEALWVRVTWPMRQVERGIFVPLVASLVSRYFWPMCTREGSYDPVRG